MKQLIFKSFVCYIILVLYSIVGSYYIDAGNDYQHSIEEEAPTVVYIIFIFGALLETLIFNFLPFFFLMEHKFFKNKELLFIFILSIFFGLGHFSSFRFVVITFFAGLVFNWHFLQYAKYKNLKYAFISTFIIHLMGNVTVYLYNTVM